VRYNSPVYVGWALPTILSTGSTAINRTIN
jgi:hypothetical protein